MQFFLTIHINAYRRILKMRVGVGRHYIERIEQCLHLGIRREKFVVDALVAYWLRAETRLALGHPVASMSAFAHALHINYLFDMGEQLSYVLDLHGAVDRFIEIGNAFVVARLNRE